MVVSLSLIDEKLRKLPAEKLTVVYDFISYLVDRGSAPVVSSPLDAVLRREWDTPEEDAAWAHLADPDMSDYLRNLEDYEERLARGEIKW